MEGEPEIYMIRDEQLVRLYLVQDLLEQQQNDISNEDALAENLL